MQLYVCCPHDTCGSFQNALSFLRRFGIEPALEHDGTHHYFEFDLPSEWQTERRIDFRWELAHRVVGLIYCRCERWLEEDEKGQAYKFTCRSCGHTYLFCQECDAFQRWAGCKCSVSTHNQRQSYDR